MIGRLALLCVGLLAAGRIPLRAASPDGTKSEHDRSWALVSSPTSDIRFEPLTRADGSPTEHFFQVFLGAAKRMIPGTIFDWRLDTTTLGVVAMCLGVGRIVAQDPVTKVYEIKIDTDAKPE